MANETVVEVEIKDEFYKNGEKYWSEIDPTLNGVLGGFGYISDIDLKGSESFLNKVFKEKGGPDRTRALDCGAGIGRITNGLLIKHFDKVDLVEQNESFLNEAQAGANGNKKLGKLFPCALQYFEPSEQYDMIWCQWVLGHLTDDDLLAFFRRCASALRPNGVIVVKENVSGNILIHDDKDSSVTRPAKTYLELFRKTPLRVIRQATQSNFPAGLFSVKIYALRRVETTSIG